MKKLTSFTKLTTGEGTRISYTYSEVDGAGNLVSQNNRATFIVVDSGVQAHLDAVESYINEKHLI